MIYSQLLKDQIDECSNKIVFLKTKMSLNNDPSKVKIIMMEIKNTEMHIYSLKRLALIFNNLSKVS